MTAWKMTLRLGLLVYLQVPLCSLLSASVRGDLLATHDSFLYHPAGARDEIDVYSISLPFVGRREMEADTPCLHTRDGGVDTARLPHSGSKHGASKSNGDYMSVLSEEEVHQDSRRDKLLFKLRDEPVTRMGSNAATAGGKKGLGPISSAKRIHGKDGAGVDGIPGLESSQLKRTLYTLLETIKSQPEEAIRTLVIGELREPSQEDLRRRTGWGRTSTGVTHPLEEPSQDKRSRHSKDSGRQTSDADQGETPATPGYADHPAPSVLSPSGLRSNRVRRRSKGVMYLPINQPQPDPCAPPKGSKLLEALPLVFLSSIMTVADAVGNVINSINNNNNNNNNNNDNNINSDNTNLAANINNANQINLVPFGGRLLRIARGVMTSVGRMALGIYEAVLPSDEEDDACDDGSDDSGTDMGNEGSGADVEDNGSDSDEGDDDDDDSTAKRTRTRPATDADDDLASNFFLEPPALMAH